MATICRPASVSPLARIGMATAALGLGALCVVGGLRPAAGKEAYPSQIVKLVVPSAPGSTTDIIARLVANELAQSWKATIVVDNIAGGAMNIGAERVARATPDGYTLFLSPPSPLTISKLLYRTLGYDPAAFSPIALIARIPNVLSVRAMLPARNVKELISLAAAHPNTLTFASQARRLAR
ncbi:MAG TPA: tripartite tricarboxylate transporter substrate-binding protein [Xanthobacteraceae bacterium]|nr:tripartite tricarboxylate transporter substrate-binding protein [Xanthobacteraceae bacterium]